VVESICNITSEFEMLRLVFAHRDVRGAIEENVCSLQDWVGEKAKLEGRFVGRGRIQGVCV
jgi:hypothetical protein